MDKQELVDLLKDMPEEAEGIILIGKQAGCLSFGVHQSLIGQVDLNKWQARPDPFSDGIMRCTIRSHGLKQVK
jgi:hypothetical protein